MANIRVVPISAHRGRGRDSGAVREAGTWLVRIARIGYAAKGILYLVIGGLAVLAAVGSRDGETTGTRGALGILGASGLGRALLLVMGVGLLGWGLWAVVAAILDAERRGSERKGIALRIGLAARGLAYGALGVAAVRLFLTSRPSSSNGEEQWTARLLAMPFGRWLVAGVGAVIIGYALYQFWSAAHKNLRKRRHLGEIGSKESRWVVRVARFGIAARAVVFLLIGWFVVEAAVRYDPARAGGIDDSLATLAAQPYRPIVLGIVALGLIAYGIWELVNARYRDMRAA